MASPNPKLAAYFDFRDSRCARALAAADFAFALEFGLRSTLDAALAAGLDVTFAGALVCDRALAAAFFAAVDLDAESVADAFVAALCPVVLFPMNALSCSDLAVDV